MRPPRQERSREGWERILAVGIELLESGGWEALTITEVCRRTGVSPPTIYARVDGRQGLFDAVYDVAMERVRATQLQWQDLATGESDVERVAHVMWRIFETHFALLRAVIRHSSSSSALLERGSEESVAMLSSLAGLLRHSDREAVDDVLRMMYAECVMRLMYGPEFLTRRPEPAEDFLVRLTAMGRARLDV